jgi:hypothetical protein
VDLFEGERSAILSLFTPDVPPRRASMFWMPASLACFRAASICVRGMLVHVRCIIVSRPRYFCAVLQISSVFCAVLPPAPQVTSTHMGSRQAILSSRSYKLFTPSSVLGGKYSNEKNVLFSVTARLILSMIFISGCTAATTNKNNEFPQEKFRIGFKPAKPGRYQFFMKGPGKNLRNTGSAKLSGREPEYHQ